MNMTTNLLFKSAEKMYHQLLKDLADIQNENQSIICCSENAIMLIDDAVRKLKTMVNSHNFESVGEEVHFFKQIKPKFTSKFIFNLQLLSIETSRNTNDEKRSKKFYKKELKKLKTFYVANRDFVKYMRQEAQYNDYKYFTRNRYDLKLLLPYQFYDLDENFSTSHDDLAAQILANIELENFLLSRINSPAKIETEKSDVSQVTWSASKVALMELLTALHHTHCFNGGNIEMSEVVKCFEKSFNIELGNFYKTIGEIKNRKNGRAKFLHLLIENLDQLFLNADE